MVFKNAEMWKIRIDIDDCIFLMLKFYWIVFPLHKTLDNSQLTHSFLSIFFRCNLLALKNCCHQSFIWECWKFPFSFHLTSMSHIFQFIILQIFHSPQHFRTLELHIGNKTSIFSKNRWLRLQWNMGEQ